MIHGHSFAAQDPGRAGGGKEHDWGERLRPRSELSGFGMGPRLRPSLVRIPLLAGPDLLGGTGFPAQGTPSFILGPAAVLFH